MARLLRTLAVPALILALTPEFADAGAWTLAEGDGQVIVTTGRSAAPVGAMFGGLADKDKSSLYVFVEYGATNRLTLGGKASADWNTTSGQVDLRLGGHMRYRIWQGNDGDVLSLQVGGSGPVHQWIGSPLGSGTVDNVVQADFNVLYGRGWLSDWGNTFISVQAGFRWRGGGRADHLRIEGTGGHAFSRRFMGLFGISAGYPVFGNDDATLKISPSLAWTMWPRLGENDKKPAEFAHPRTLQIGLEYDALNPDDGLGFLVSVWNRF